MFSQQLNQPNIQLSSNQIANAIKVILNQLVSSNRIDSVQYSSLMSIISQDFSSYMQQLMMKFPNGIPQELIESIAKTIVEKNIEKYNLQFQSNNFQSGFNPNSVFNVQSNFNPTNPFDSPNQINRVDTNQFDNRENNIFENFNKPDVDNSKENESSEQEGSTIDREIIVLDNDNPKKQELQTINRQIQFKDKYNNPYIADEITIENTIFNNFQELLKTFAQLNKETCSNSINYFHIVNYKKYFYIDNVELSAFKEQYDKVRRNFIMNSSNNVFNESIIKAFTKTSYDFVKLFQKLIVNEINTRLRKFCVTNKTIKAPFSIETIDDIPDLFGLATSNPNDPIVTHPRFRSSINNTIINGFNKYFSKNTRGVLNPVNDFELLIFCNDILLLPSNSNKENQNLALNESGMFRNSFLGNLLKEPEKKQEIISKFLSNITVIDTKETICLTNIKPDRNSMNKLLNKETILAKNAYDENYEISEIGNLYNNNLELILDVMVANQEYNCPVYLLDHLFDPIAKFDFGRTMNGNLFLMK